LYERTNRRNRPASGFGDLARRKTFGQRDRHTALGRSQSKGRSDLLRTQPGRLPRVHNHHDSGHVGLTAVDTRYVHRQGSLLRPTTDGCPTTCAAVSATGEHQLQEALQSFHVLGPLSPKTPVLVAETALLTENLPAAVVRLNDHATAVKADQSNLTLVQEAGGKTVAPRELAGNARTTGIMHPASVQSSKRRRSWAG